MRKIRDDEKQQAAPDTEPDAEPDAELRAILHAFLAEASAGRLKIHLPQRLSEPVSRGPGHFHLAPELFLQHSGWTDFNFPTGRIRLQAGEALVVPPQLRHLEVVGAGRGQVFRNVVVFAEGPRVSCHTAFEDSPGHPEVAHLQDRIHAQAARIHDWLFEASQAGATDDALAESQARALLSASIAGVLRALHEGNEGTAAEPPLLARLRVLIQNQLGDHGLSVAGLAEQSGCSADHLSQLFRQASGEPLLAYINRQRMERAARLLRETTLAGKEVAWACGFSAHNYFIRVFRAHHGMTPQAWRQSAR